MDLALTDRVALVAGSSQGLGFALARQLAQEGATVVICGRRADVVARAVAELNGAFPTSKALGMTADVTQPQDVKALVNETLQTFKGIDILVTNAGGPPGGRFESLTMSQWTAALDVTLLSAVRLIQEALPHLRRSDAASILTITSISAKQPLADLFLSNAIRPAVLGLTKTLSQELAADGIRVNSILPGWTQTERVDALLAHRAASRGTSLDIERARVIAGIPLGRIADPDEFARVAAFLVSPAASYLTGVMLQVDGGAYAGLI